MDNSAYNIPPSQHPNNSMYNKAFENDKVKRLEIMRQDNNRGPGNRSSGSAKRK